MKFARKGRGKEREKRIACMRDIAALK